MARMVDLIREGVAPASMMRRAAQGGLSLPAGEMIEILVALANHQELGAQAAQTLEGWNEGALIEAASDTSTSPEVLAHLLRVHIQKPAVVAALRANPVLREEAARIAKAAREAAIQRAEEIARAEEAAKAKAAVLVEAERAERAARAARNLESLRVAEAARLAAEQKAETEKATRIAEEARLAEIARRRAEDAARAAETARLEEIGRREAEEAARIAEEARLAEIARVEAEEAARVAEDARLAEIARLEAEEAARVAEEARLAEIVRLEAAEAARLAEIARREVEEAACIAEEARLAEIARAEAEEAARVAEEVRLAEIARLEAEEAARIAEEARLAEIARLEAEEAARIAEEARLTEIARLEAEEAARVAEVARLAEIARLEAEEAARVTEEARLAEIARIESEEAARIAEAARLAEIARIEAAEAARISEVARQAEIARAQAGARAKDAAMNAEAKIAAAKEALHAAEEAKAEAVAAGVEAARLDGRLFENPYQPIAAPREESNVKLEVSVAKHQMEGSLLDLVRSGAAPISMMRLAAKGALSLPANEVIEILVLLAELGVAAEQAIESWDERSMVAVAASRFTPTEVLVHILLLQVQRPAVIAALCDNPALPLAELGPTARHASGEVLQVMLRSSRVGESKELRELMAANPALAQRGQEEEEDAATGYLALHAEDIAKEEGQLFELVACMDGEDDPLSKLLERVKDGETPSKSDEIEHVSLLQKIGSMRVSERIKLAMRGNREERMVLIRDRSKLVSLAVLESPKVTDTEMESFAAMKNIQEAVLRAISTKRNYIKNYGVLRALVTNPKTPLDVALPMVAHLLLKDQRTLAVNKNVNETLRKTATRLFRIKSQRK